ncbi:MAG TPA: ABC transporter permease [Flavobacteriales bacterium]|jgi:lipoprotein-releasing system permease protein|nr:ABC transporter permease [Flavobacteriales bacterium]
MAFAHFIARRILSDKDRVDRLSRPIVVIAVLGIVIGMAVMILTVGISTGFQREVRSKVSGAGSHIEIVPIAQTDPKGSLRLPIAQPFYPSLDTLKGVQHIQVFAVAPGIVETPDEIQGVVVKGVGPDHDWSFLRDHLVAGEVLQITDSARSEALISNWMAKRLRQQVGDTVTIYLVKGREDIRPRKYRIKGIYETGLEKVDHQIVFIDLAHLQRFEQWGLQAEVLVSDVENGRFVELEGVAFGGDRNYTYEWPGTTLKGPGPHRLQLWDWHNPELDYGPTQQGPKDTTFMLIVHDDQGTLPDTAWVHIVPDLLRPITHSLGSESVVESIRVERRGSGGSYKRYVGGFEVAVDDYRDLIELDDAIYRDHLPEGLRTITVREKFPEIFAWLELLDTNVIVVIVLMVIVAIINMTSALLIIILERTNMIGVLKALGTSNGTIRRIFLIDAAYILGFGIVLGDLLGITLALVQKGFGIVRLPIESYYVDQVPVDLDLGPILLLNAGTLLVCVLALVLPSMLVTRIAPARAIRFD